MRQVVAGVFVSLDHRVLELGGLVDKADELVGEAHDQVFLYRGRDRRGERFFGERGIGQLADKGGDSRGDVLARHVDHGERFDVDLLAVGLQLDLAAGAVLGFGDDVVLDKEIDVLLIHEVRVGFGNGFEVEQAASLGFLHPFVGVVVAVEDDRLVFDKSLADQPLDSGIHVLRVLERLIELTQFLGDHGVEHVVRAADIQRGTESAELEFVAGEGERRGTVAVGGVLLEVGEHVDAGLHTFLAVADVFLAVDDGLHQLAEVVAEIHGDDRRRRFVRA